MSFIRKHVYFVKKKEDSFLGDLLKKKLENFTNFLRQDFEVLQKHRPTSSVVFK